MTAKRSAVFKLDMTGHLTVLYSFTGGADGAYPIGGVILYPVGNLYGTAGGGTAGYGVVFELAATGQLSVLHSFKGQPDGAYPNPGVVRDPAGNLYGSTINGGGGNEGTVFKLDTAGHLSVLYSFGGGTDGSSPYGSLIRDPAGNLFGTTVSGGTAGWGTLYKLDPERRGRIQAHGRGGGAMITPTVFALLSPFAEHCYNLLSPLLRSSCHG